MLSPNFSRSRFLGRQAVRRQNARRQLLIQPLEDRRVLAAASMADGAVTVHTGDGDNQIAV